MVSEIIFHEPITQWDWKIGQYVALIGLAGGAYLVGYVADILGLRTGSRAHSQVAKYGYLTGLLVMAVSPLVMLSHLATPFRAMALPLTMSNLGSWMAIGSYLMGGFAFGSFLMFAWMAFGKARPGASAGSNLAADGGKVTDGGTADAATGTGGEVGGGFRGVANRVGLLGILDTFADRTRPSGPARLGIGALFGITAAGVLLYSAMALGSGPTGRVPLWDKTFFIPVQITGGLATGLVTAVGLAALAERATGRTVQKYAVAGAGLLVVYLLTSVASSVVLPGHTPAAEAGVASLVGEYTALFVGLGIVGGVVIPAALSLAAVFGRRVGSLSESGAVAAYTTAAALVIAGKLAVGLSYLLAANFTPLPLPV
mgnify:CR=1 FL=1